MSRTTPHTWDGDAVKYPPLSEDLDVDVLVVGGGITGVSTAELLSRHGLRVALLERYQLGHGDTGHTTAHLTYMTDIRLAKLVKVFGEQHAGLAWQAGQAAMQHIQETSSATGLDVGLTEVDGYLAAADGSSNSNDAARLREEAGIANRLGFDVVFRRSIPPTGRPGLHFPRQMKVHPLRYLHALAAAATKRGARIHEQSAVTGFGSGPLHAIANSQRIGYGYLVVATHVPLQGTRSGTNAALLQTKLALSNTYALAAKVPPGTLPQFIWSDTAKPFHYLRVDAHSEHDVLIFGGEDHKTGQRSSTQPCFQQLERALRQMITNFEVASRWSGQVVETVDGLPYIGEADDRMFLATGYSGNGMTFGTVAAMMARDWVLGHANPWCDTFDPNRRKLQALPNYVLQNSDYPRHFIADRLQPMDNYPIDKGEGHIIKAVDGRRVAVCRDANGRHHTSSAVCPHLGCIVNWNDSQLTWDCPCHGSRFAADGKLLAGPAETDLQPLDLP